MKKRELWEALEKVEDLLLPLINGVADGKQVKNFDYPVKAQMTIQGALSGIDSSDKDKAAFAELFGKLLLVLEEAHQKQDVLIIDKEFKEMILPFRLDQFLQLKKNASNPGFIADLAAMFSNTQIPKRPRPAETKSHNNQFIFCRSNTAH